ncbi:hypothetical protein, partial [Thiolapillus sp.]|uniref:hypothetical protein n=1 Tax=Thiolapillus sp. TaxID=2017437 RepID=UPI003AF7AE2C
ASANRCRGNFSKFIQLESQAPVSVHLAQTRLRPVRHYLDKTYCDDHFSGFLFQYIECDGVHLQATLSALQLDQFTAALQVTGYFSFQIRHHPSSLALNHIKRTQRHCFFFV